MKKFFVLCSLFSILFCLIGCDSPATVASYNVSQAADRFEVYRRVVFYNGITDQYILEIDGYSSVEFFSDKFVVTVKTGPNTYLKHYLGKADNVFPFVEQLEDVPVSDRHYRVIFRPSVIVPTLQIE